MALVYHAVCKLFCGCNLPTRKRCRDHMPLTSWSPPLDPLMARGKAANAYLTRSFCMYAYHVISYHIISRSPYVCPPTPACQFPTLYPPRGNETETPPEDIGHDERSRERTDHQRCRSRYGSTVPTGGGRGGHQVAGGFCGPHNWR